jgi:outer membrane lipoprotein SlyB
MFMIHSALRTAAVVAAMFTGVALAQAPAPAAAKCTDCGVVQAVRFVEVKGSSSGVGMVAGGVLGGVLGHQIGSGRGNTVATIAGAAGGAYVGNEVEKKKNTKGQWNVVIKMDSGQQRTFVYSSQPTVHDGDRVKLIDGGRRLALVAS